MNKDNFQKALDYFESIEKNPNPGNPFSPIEKYSCLRVVHFYNQNIDFPVLNFSLEQLYRENSGMPYAEIINAKDIKKQCEYHVDRCAKRIFASMKIHGEVYGKYFE